jgi:hypothetical protein
LQSSTLLISKVDAITCNDGFVEDLAKIKLILFPTQVGFDPMTGVMMSTQQDNREVAEGHSLADRYFFRFW